MRTLFNVFLVVLFASSAASTQSIFDLLHDGPAGVAIEVVLTLPVDSIQELTRQDQPGVLAFTDRQGIQRNFSTKLSVRGKFRRSRCGYPPLKLDFSKKDLAALGLAEHDKYKLVTTCYSDSVATNLLLKEYLAYRAYALLSPTAHFRAQLLRVTYRDGIGTYPDRTDYAILLEDTDEMAARAGGTELDDAHGLKAERYAAHAEATHALFQYLLGNGDWSLPLHRNVKIISLPDGQLVPVGYDFDFSGWVGAPYASPSRDYGQQSIYQRVYLGYAQSDRTLREVAQEFRSNRRELLQLIGGFELLPKQERVILQRFVQRFYGALNAMTTDSGSMDLYDKLRGDTASVIPPGAEARSYRGSARR